MYIRTHCISSTIERHIVGSLDVYEHWINSSSTIVVNAIRNAREQDKRTPTAEPEPDAKAIFIVIHQVEEFLLYQMLFH